MLLIASNFPTLIFRLFFCLFVYNQLKCLHSQSPTLILTHFWHLTKTLFVVVLVTAHRSRNNCDKCLEVVSLNFECLSNVTTSEKKCCFLPRLSDQRALCSTLTSSSFTTVHCQWQPQMIIQTGFFLRKEDSLPTHNRLFCAETRGIAVCPWIFFYFSFFD